MTCSQFFWAVSLDKSDGGLLRYFSRVRNCSEQYENSKSVREVSIFRQVERVAATRFSANARAKRNEIALDNFCTNLLQHQIVFKYKCKYVESFYTFACAISY